MAKNRGNYYKLKSKSWMEKLGYQTELLERFQRFFNPKTKQVGFIKRDLFGADGLSMNGEEMIFWNSVFGRKNVAGHIKKFNEFPYPKIDKVKHWILIWELRVKEPEIEEVQVTIKEER